MIFLDWWVDSAYAKLKLQLYRIKKNLAIRFHLSVLQWDIAASILQNILKIGTILKIIAMLYLFYL